MKLKMAELSKVIIEKRNDFVLRINSFTTSLSVF